MRGITARQFKHSRRRITRPPMWRLRLLFWGGALLVGLAGALLTRISIGANEWFHHAADWHLLVPLVVTPMGFLLISWLVRRTASGACGSGVPQVTAALRLRDRSLRDGLLSFRIALTKFVGLSGAWLCGASAGMVGPSVQIGASLMYGVHRYAHFPHYQLHKGLILAGGAAGLSAALGTPLAGLVFAIEELNRSFDDRHNISTLMAVVLASLAPMLVLESTTRFELSYTSLTLEQALLPVLACGLLGGLAGGIFSRLLITIGRALRQWRERHPHLLAAAFGVLVALIGLASTGDTSGTGMPEAQAILRDESLHGVEYALMKFAATLATFLSGIPAGIFAPSLSVGAGFGAGFAEWFDGLPYLAVVLLAIAGYFAGVLQTPITAVVIVMELSSNYTGMLLPLLATALLAHLTSRQVCRKPLYLTLLDDYLAQTEKRT